jgi:hypothetical protein
MRNNPQQKQATALRTHINGIQKYNPDEIFCPKIILKKRIRQRLKKGGADKFSFQSLNFIFIANYKAQNFLKIF